MLAKFKYLEPFALQHIPKMCFSTGNHLGTHEPPIIVRSYEKIPDYADKAKDHKLPPWEKSIKIRRREKGIEKNAYTWVAQWEAALEVGQMPYDLEEPYEDEDFWGKDEEKPVPHKFDKHLKKELFWIPREKHYWQKAYRKSYHLQEFCFPLEIHHDEIKELLIANIKLIHETLGADIRCFTDPNFNPSDIFTQNPEILQNFKKIAELIPFANYRIYPNLSIQLGVRLRYQEDVAGIWQAMETELFKVLFNMSFMELVKLKYGLSFLRPKGGSTKLHKAINDLLLQDIPQASFEEFMHLYHAFKSNTNRNLHRKLRKIYLEKSLEGVGNDYYFAVDALYTYINCQMKMYLFGDARDPTINTLLASKLATNLYDVIHHNILRLDTEYLSKLALSISLIRNDYFRDMLARIQTATLQKLDKVDSFQLATIIYAFSKCNNGRSDGKQKFWEGLVPLVKKFWNEFDDIDKSRIFYAYAYRQVMEDELYNKYILPWVDSKMPEFSYAELANVSYGLIFMGDTSKERFFGIMKNVCWQKYALPVVFYKALKYTRFYYETMYSGYDLQYFETACYAPEREFDQRRVRKHKVENERYTDVSRIIRNDLDLDCQALMDWENLILIDYAFLPQKVCVMVYFEEDFTPYTNELNPKAKLELKILEANKWDVIRIDYKDFVDQGPKRVEWLKEKLMPALQAKEYTIQYEHQKLVFDLIEDAENRNLRFWTYRHSVGEVYEKAQKIAFSDPNFRERFYEVKKQKEDEILKKVEAKLH